MNLPFLRFVIALSLTLCGQACLVAAELPAGWEQRDVKPVAGRSAGMVTCKAGIWQVKGAAEGTVAFKRMKGDFQITARVVQFIGKGHGNRSAGLFISEDLDQQGLFAQGEVRCAQEDGRRVETMVRAVRWHDKTAVYQSRDGGLSWYYHDAGRSLVLGKEEVLVGLYAGGFGGAEAEIDQVEIAPWTPAYATSWLAGPLGGNKTESFLIKINSIWTDSDGTCYAGNTFNEQTHTLGIFNKGRDCGSLPGTAGVAMSGNRSRVFVAEGDGFRVYDKASRKPVSPTVVSVRDRAEGKVKEGGAVRGLCADETELWLGNAECDQVECWDAEKLERRVQYPFLRPGAVAKAADGRIWVVQRRLMAPTDPKAFRRVHPDPREGVQEKAAVLCLDARTGKELARIEDAEIPTALLTWKEGATLVLAVADNGLDQQIKLYDISGPQARPLRTIGQKGGVFSGVPGAFAPDKFDGLAALGRDAEGNLYVGMNSYVYDDIGVNNGPRGADLRCLGPDGSLRWHMATLVFMDGASIDPGDESSVYVRGSRMQLDWSKSQGREWSLAARTNNPLLLPDEPLANWCWQAGPMMRRVAGRPVMYKRHGGALFVFRKDPERFGEGLVPTQMIWPTVHLMGGYPQGRPAGIGQNGLSWVDGANGGPVDGRIQPQELSDMGRRYPGCDWYADYAGGVWRWADAPIPHPNDPRRSEWWRFKTEFEADGRPKLVEVENVRELPAPFTGQQIGLMRYQPEQDRMVIVGKTLERPRGFFHLREAAVYEGWDKGNRTPRLRIPLPWSLDYFAGPGEPGDNTASVDIAGDFLFVGAYKPGKVHVYDLRLGNKVLELLPGPEVLGSCGDLDIAEALSAHRRANGEYVVLTEEDAYGKIVMYRWQPATPAKVPTIAPTVEAAPHAGCVELRWGTVGDTGMLIGYVVERAERASGPWTRIGGMIDRPWLFDEGRIDGKEVFYRVRCINVRGEGPNSEPLRVVPQQAKVQFIAIDAATQGDWKGVYGGEGQDILGDLDEIGLPNNPRWPTWFDAPRYCMGFRSADRYNTVKAAPGEISRLLLAKPGSTERSGTSQTTRPGSVYQRRICITDGGTWQVAVYCPSGASRLELIEARSGKVLDTRDAIEAKEDRSTKRTGRWVVWNVSGNLILRVSSADAKGQGQFGGVFFDKVGSAPK